MKEIDLKEIIKDRLSREMEAFSNLEYNYFNYDEIDIISYIDLNDCTILIDDYFVGDLSDEIENYINLINDVDSERFIKIINFIKI